MISRYNLADFRGKCNIHQMYFRQRIEKANKKGRDDPFLRFGILLMQRGAGKGALRMARGPALLWLVLVFLP